MFAQQTVSPLGALELAKSTLVITSFTTINRPQGRRLGVSGANLDVFLVFIIVGRLQEFGQSPGECSPVIAREWHSSLFLKTAVGVSVVAFSRVPMPYTATFYEWRRGHIQLHG